MASPPNSTVMSLPATFEGVPEEPPQLDVLHGQTQEDGLVGTLKLVLPQREVIGNVVNGLCLLVAPDRSRVCGYGVMSVGHTHTEREREREREDRKVDSEQMFGGHVQTPRPHKCAYTQPVKQ